MMVTNRTQTIKIMMILQGDFWPFMVDGCHADRPTDLVIKKFGFSSVSQKKYDLPLETRDGSLVFKTRLPSLVCHKASCHGGGYQVTVRSIS